MLRRKFLSLFGMAPAAVILANTEAKAEYVYPVQRGKIVSIPTYRWKYDTDTGFSRGSDGRLAITLGSDHRAYFNS